MQAEIDEDKKERMGGGWNSEVLKKPKIRQKYQKEAKERFSEPKKWNNIEGEYKQ